MHQKKVVKVHPFSRGVGGHQCGIYDIQVTLGLNVHIDAENPWENPNDNNLPMVGFRHLC